jgi:hypothetical protein
MRKLPTTCATKNMDGKPIVIVKGETGYMLMSKGFDIDEFNTNAEATEEDIKVMTCASMFGWDIPAVKNYEEGK